MDVYQLNREQQKAFNALRRAANKCAKLNIGFVNLYGSVTAFDNDLIEAFGVDANYEISCMEHGYPPNYINNLGGDSFADDQYIHSFKLTDKGRKVHQNEM